MSHLVHLPHRSLISIKGRDTFKYLQALTTNNLAKPSSQFTSLLNAQGRVLYDAFIYKIMDTECLLEVDASLADNVMSHLKRYKLRSKFEMRRIDDSERAVYALFNSNHGQGASHSKLSSLGEDTIVLHDPRAPSLGHRIIASRSPSSVLELPHSATSHYRRHRYRHAVPEGPSELLSEKALPMESNIDYMNGLDFHKGCYLGQELTVRTYHTGVIRKRIVPVRLNVDNHDGQDGNDVEWSVGAEDAQVTIPNESGIKARPAGRVLAGLGNLGIALMRLDKIGQPGLATINGQQASLVASRPTHWPEKPESM